MKENKNSNYFKAIEYFKKKDFDNALSLFNEEIKKNPFRASLYYYIGRIFYYKKDCDKAIAYLKVAYDFNNENIIFNFYYGKALLFVDENKALECFEKSFDKIKESSFYIAIIYYKKKDYQKSLQYFNNVPQYILDKKICKNILSLCYSNIGNEFYFISNYREAKNFFLEAIKINVNNYSAHFQIGSIYLIESNFLNAKKHFEYLYKRFKNNDSIKISLAYIYFNLNELSGLEKILKEIKIENFSPYVDIYEFRKILAYTLYQRKKYKEAIPLFIQLYNKKRFDENILFYLAQSRFNTGDYRKTENIYKLIFDITKKNIFINNSYILFLIAIKDFKKAEDVCLSFINNKTYNDKTILYLYYVSINNDNFNFVKIYREYLSKIFYNNPIFLEAEAIYYLKQKDYSQSLLYFYKLYELNPLDTWVINNMIDIFHIEGLNDLALQYLEKLYNYNKNENISLFYAYFLTKSGNFKKSIHILTNFSDYSYKADYLLGDIYLKMKNNKKGLFYLRESFYKNPLYLPTQFKSLTFFYKKNNLNMALKLCKLMKFTNKEFKNSLIYEALVYFRKGRPDISIELVEDYLKFFKERDNSFLKLGLAYLYYFENKIDYAIKIVKHLIKKNGEYANYLIILALCHRKRYNLEEQRKIESILKKEFSNSPSFLEYKAKYLSTSPQTYKRKDIGIRIP